VFHTCALQQGLDHILVDGFSSARASVWVDDDKYEAVGARRRQSGSSGTRAAAGAKDVGEKPREHPEQRGEREERRDCVEERRHASLAVLLPQVERNEALRPSVRSDLGKLATCNLQENGKMRRVNGLIGVSWLL